MERDGERNGERNGELSAGYIATLRLYTGIVVTGSESDAMQPFFVLHPRIPSCAFPDQRRNRPSTSAPTDFLHAVFVCMTLKVIMS